MKEKNLQGKTVPRSKAYEIWSSGDWTWYVRKKYQAPGAEAANPFARWFCDVVTPMSPRGDTGDVYVREIKGQARRIDAGAPPTTMGDVIKARVDLKELNDEVKKIIGSES